MKTIFILIIFFLVVKFNCYSQSIKKDTSYFFIGGGIGINNIISNDASGNSALSASLHIGNMRKLNRHINLLALFSYNYRSNQTIYSNMQDLDFNIPVYLHSDMTVHEFNSSFLFHYNTTHKLSIGCGLVLKYLITYTIDQYPLGYYGMYKETIDSWYSITNSNQTGILNKTNIAPALCLSYPFFNNDLLLGFISSYDLRENPVHPFFRPTYMFNYFNLLTNQVILSFKLKKNEKSQQKRKLEPSE